MRPTDPRFYLSDEPVRPTFKQLVGGFRLQLALNRFSANDLFLACFLNTIATVVLILAIRG